MGYMGLSSIADSDNASDFAGDVMDAVAKVFKEHAKLKDNEFNTNGDVDVALFVERVILPAVKKAVFLRSNVPKSMLAVD